MLNITPNIKTEDMSAYLRSFVTLSNGTAFTAVGFNGLVAQVWVVNLSNGLSKVFSLTNDPPAPSGIPWMPNILTFSNTLLVTASANLFAGMWEINLTNLTSTRIGTNTDKLVVSICRAPDGVVFMGTYGTVRVDEWNPSNRVFRTWGYADDSLVGVGNYAYYINASLGFIYTTVRDGNSWYLSIIERATSNKTFYWKSPVGSSLTVYDGLDGKVYADIVTNGLHGYFLLTNDVPVGMTLAAFNAIPKYDPNFQEPGINNDFDNWDTQLAWDVDINATAYSINNGIPSTSLRWKPTNSVVWQSVTETNGWLPVTGIIDFIQPWLENNFLWVTHNYGPVGTFTTSGGVAVVGDYKNQSTRAILKVSPNEVYFAGYHLSTFRWNPYLPWTRTPSTQSFTDTNYNPYTMDETGGKYHTELVKGSDGRIFNASQWARNGDGGSLGWYNPTNGALGTERTTFTNINDSPTDLKPAEGASKLVWLSWGGNVFIWDVPTFTKVTNFTLGIALMKCVEYESGKMFGIAQSNMLGFTTTGSILWSNNLPAAAFNPTQLTVHYDRITLGPDNRIWQTAGGVLYRINPFDGSYVSVMTTTNNYKIIFDEGNSGYLYGGTTVWQIQELLTKVKNFNLDGGFRLNGRSVIY